jgi:hypothetical protein
MTSAPITLSRDSASLCANVELMCANFHSGRVHLGVERRLTNFGPSGSDERRPALLFEPDVHCFRSQPGKK